MSRHPGFLAVVLLFPGCCPCDRGDDPLCEGVEVEEDSGAPEDTGETQAPEDTDEPVDTGDPSPLRGWPERVFAPFVDATLYPTAKLAQISAETGLRWYSLGFVVSDPSAGCVPSWGGYYDLATGPVSWDEGGEYSLYEQLEALRSQHDGDFIVSLGGAAGTPLAAACGDVPSLLAAYREVVDQLELSRLDFDVEGTWVADHAPGGSVTRRAQAAAQLQAELAAEGRSLDIWLTLPVLPTGLTPDGEAVVEAMLAAGVKLAGVNVMTMDYGDSAAPDPDGQMGAYGIQAVTALHAQLDTAFAAAGQALGQEALWARIGTTPMIGLNDVISETFHLEDARQTRAFAEEMGLGWISMWSLQRDHPCPERSYVDLTCSSSPDQSQDWEFSGIFGGYGE